MDDGGIDPRYAPQFQRGFDPSTAPTAPPVAPTHSTRSAAVRLEGGPLPSAPRVADPPPFRPRVRANEEAQDAGEPELESVRTPPIEWALLVVGVLLLVAAGWVFWMSATDLRQYLGTYDPAGYAFMAARNSLPGPFLVAGVLAITVWVVLRALRRRS